MTDMDGKYYLGKVWDPKTGKTTDEALRYDSEDLTTHAVIIGMTGSAAAVAKHPPKPVSAFEISEIRVEQNATDGDTEVVIFAGWKNSWPSVT